MNRGTKLKAWDTIEERMCLVKAINWDEELLYWSLPDGREDWWPIESFIILQPTGKKDKTGKVIYEGDLVTTDSGAVMKVCYRDDMCRFVLRLNDHSASSDLDSDLKVIGTFYENHELLTNGK